MSAIGRVQSGAALRYLVRHPSAGYCCLAAATRARVSPVPAVCSAAQWTTTAPSTARAKGDSLWTWLGPLLARDGGAAGQPATAWAQ